MSYVTTLQNTPALKAAVDNVMVVKSPYINISGLKPGYEVIIKDLKTGDVVYDEVAKGTSILINAERLGIINFPMRAEVKVIRS